MKTKFVSQSFAKRAMMVLAVLFTTLTASATEFITDVMVIGGSKNEVEELKTTYKAQGWTLGKNVLQIQVEVFHAVAATAENGEDGPYYLAVLIANQSAAKS